MARLDPLTSYLMEANQDRLVLSFAEIETILGGALPASARRHPAFWSNSEQAAYSRAWTSAGYIASRRGLGPEQVAFIRVSSGLVQRPQRAYPLRPLSPRMEPTAILVGCVSQKHQVVRPAKDLYRSELFRRRRAYAEESQKPWLILSALHGLVEPDRLLEPYDLRLTELPHSKRIEWARAVMASLELRFGSLKGRVLEIHAGDDYVQALRPRLQSTGAILTQPLRGLRLGEQLAWYKKHVPVEANALGLALRITKAFAEGALNLSKRPNPPSPGWEGMPEIVATHRLRKAGATLSDVRLFVTFMSAMDRAREADRLWKAGADLFLSQPWVFRPEELVSGSLTALVECLSTRGVSQRHGPDSAAWRVIAESLLDKSRAARVRAAVYDGAGDAVELLEEVRSRAPWGTYFPFLSGPKIGPMWVRMLVHPGGATISSLGKLPVSVDVQVRKVSEYLGVTNTRGRSLESVRNLIQQAWQTDVEHYGAEGPSGLEGTAVAVDPALWFYGKWGCTWCERMRQKVPISTICDECRFDSMSGERGKQHI